VPVAFNGRVKISFHARRVCAGRCRAPSLSRDFAAPRALTWLLVESSDDELLAIDFMFLFA
jgi:hypothetical protein